jgi:monoamine oxidase
MSDPRDDDHPETQERSALQPGGVSRRRFFQGVAGTAAGLTVAGGLDVGEADASAAVPPSPLGPFRTQGTLRTVDVAVVGAGLSGLVAAHRLAESDHSVVVLDARGRTGGRILNAPVGGGQVVEAGAEFLGAKDTLLRHLVLTELALPTYPTFAEGDIVLNLGGQTATTGGDLSWLLEAADRIVGLGAVLGQLDEMAATLPLDQPITAPDGLDWDSQTLSSWLGDNVPDPAVRDVVGVAVQGLFGGSLSDASLLHTLYSAHVHGGIIATGSIQGGSQQDRVQGGSQQITDALARKLRGRIILNAPVRVIDQTGKRVMVATDRGTVAADAVIVAVPPTLAGRIQYLPALPGLRDQLTQRMPMGYAMKIHAVYPTPFWREKGLSGVAVSDAGPVTLGFDNSPDGSRAGRGVLLGFVFAEQGRIWGPRPPAQRKAAVLHQFASWFGPPAATPVRYLEQNWTAEPWTRGYIGYMPTDVWTRYGPSLRAPVGRVHWAGTETGMDGFGGLEGAVQAAQRAVSEVTG